MCACVSLTHDKGNLALVLLNGLYSPEWYLQHCSKCKIMVSRIAWLLSMIFSIDGQTDRYSVCIYRIESVYTDRDGYTDRQTDRQSIYTVVVRIIGTLGKYDKIRLWKLICIVDSLLIFFFKSQKYNLSLDNTNLKWGEISLRNTCIFYNTHWLQLSATFHAILFETSIYQFNSSNFSPIMLDEVREHLTRDQRPSPHPEPLQTL